MVRIPGSWSSFDHIEEVLTLDELMLLYGTITDKINEDREFAASLKGIDLRGNNEEESSSFEEVQRRAQAKLAGKSEDELEFADLGFGFAEVSDGD